MSIMDLGKLKRIKRVELYEIILAQDEEIKRLRQETADSVKSSKEKSIQLLDRAYHPIVKTELPGTVFCW